MRSHGSTTGVVVFDTLEVVMNILEDPRIVCDTNIAYGFNFWYGTHSQSDIYGDFHTVDMWNPASDCLIGDDPHRFPVPLVAFYGKTHTDNKGILAISPSSLLSPS